jgi:hypothetical protein
VEKLEFSPVREPINLLLFQSLPRTCPSRDNYKLGTRPGCNKVMLFLEKSVYDRDGFYVVMISRRSIDKAKENKLKRRKWTDSGDK